MHCPWCHNFYLIPYEFSNSSQIIKEDDFLSFLDQRKEFLDGVVITGGEPTTQSDLPELCEKIKNMGLAVKIDTNGTNPAVLNQLQENALVDYIAMDIKTDLGQYNQLFREYIDVNEILKSIDLIMSSGKPYEFRTTCVSPFVTLENIDKIGTLIKGADRLFLQKCNQTTDVETPVAYGIVNEDGLVELKQRVGAYVLNCDIR